MLFDYILSRVKSSVSFLLDTGEVNVLPVSANKKYPNTPSLQEYPELQCIHDKEENLKETLLRRKQRLLNMKLESFVFFCKPRNNSNEIDPAVKDLLAFFPNAYFFQLVEHQAETESSRLTQHFDRAFLLEWAQPILKNPDDWKHLHLPWGRIFQTVQTHLGLETSCQATEVEATDG